uniref:DUF1618 domain-containing protein n=1 Tax=Setaria viridis TaxID=4556 RepID=A0A4U6T9T6_SETVI|nr:hypothetical protein SEVIR_9G502900v2 [Setaria viridis]
MPKRHRSDDAGDRRSRSSCRRCPPQRHLYVVLDDWSRGYSIYKLDVDGSGGGDPDDADLYLRAERLPEPPVFRLEMPVKVRGRFALFAAVGTRIFAMDYSDENRDAPVLVYDTATGALAVGPATPAELQYLPKLVAAGDRWLYALDRKASGGGDHLMADGAGAARDGRAGCWRRDWGSIRDAALGGGRAPDCHAAHPDGRTVFFSVHGRGTFSLDNRTEEWARHGEWTLPFRGQAELDAWVGLRWVDGDDAAGQGLVCSCDVVPPDPDDGDGREPAWKVAEVVEADGERTVAVKLARMGGGVFCLVERRRRRGAHDDGDGRCLLYATTFRLRYGKDGELRAAERRARCYAVHKRSHKFEWQAFGI